jgi:hypothetical protein
MADETTDRMFPPPERGATVEPLPLVRDLRHEYLAHRRHIDGELRAFRLELGEALVRFSPPITAASVGAKVKAGALASLRYGSVALALGEAAAQVANVAGRPDIEGPIRVLVQLLGGA